MTPFSWRWFWKRRRKLLTTTPKPTQMLGRPRRQFRRAARPQRKGRSAGHPPSQPKHPCESASRSHSLERSPPRVPQRRQSTPCSSWVPRPPTPGHKAAEALGDRVWPRPAPNGERSKCLAGSRLWCFRCRQNWDHLIWVQPAHSKYIDFHHLEKRP